MRGGACSFASRNCKGMANGLLVLNKPKQPGGQIISPCREVTSQGLFPTSAEAGGHPGRPGGLSPDEKFRISGGSPGPHHTIPACRGAHRDLLHLQPSTTLHSCPHRAMLTSWEGAEDLFNADLLTKLVLQAEASASWPSPAVVAQTDIAESQEIRLRRPGGPSPPLPACRPG